MNEIGKTELVKLLQEQLPATRGDDGSGVTMLAHARRCVFGDPPPEPDSNAAALAILNGMAAALPDVEAAARVLVDADRAERDRKGGPVTARTDWTAETGPRQWLVEGWLPAGRVALLSGQGGAGKSRLALQLALALVERRKNWLPDGPDLVDSGPAVIATWEDEPDEVARRLRGMVETQDRLEALKDRLHVLDFAGKGAFWQPVEGGSRHTSTMGDLTPAGAWTRTYCETHKARLLVVDPLAAAYACSENDRGLVRAFMTSWDGWARATNCAVLIVSHPPKSSADYSGSTDWHAAARAVWKLGTEETDAGNGTGAPRLDCLKTSYGTPNRQYWLSGWPAWKAVDAQQAAVDYGSLKAKFQGTDGKAAAAGDAQGDTNETQGWQDDDTPLY